MKYSFSDDVLIALASSMPSLKISVQLPSSCALLESRSVHLTTRLQPDKRRRWNCLPYLDIEMSITKISAFLYFFFLNLPRFSYEGPSEKKKYLYISTFTQISSKNTPNKITTSRRRKKMSKKSFSDFTPRKLKSSYLRLLPIP